MSNTTILVTGANGLLGNALLGTHQKNPHITFIATGRGAKRPAVPDEVPYYACDLSNELEVKALLEQTTPDVVIHGAAMTQVDYCENHPEECMQANVDATSYFEKYSPDHTRIVLISTDFVFDGTQAMYRETDEPNPISVYGESKLRAEAILQKSKRSYAILRTMLVYGYAPNLSRTNIVLWVVESLSQNKPINVVNDQFRGPTLVDNLADASMRAAESSENGVFHISSSDYISMYHFAVKIAHIWGLNDALISAISTKDLGQPAARPPKTGFVVDKAMQAFGFLPVSIDEGLRILKNRMDV